MKLEPFFEYSRKRYQIKLDKEAGKPHPLTNDPALQKFSFCNIHREDDRVTRWIRQNVPYEKHRSTIIGATIIARWFNRIETLEHILPHTQPSKYIYRHHVPEYADNLFSSWNTDSEKWENDLRFRLKDVSPLITGAYMVATPRGKNKLEGIIDCLKQTLPETIDLYCCINPEKVSLECVWERIKTFPYMGAFNSYEIVTDLRHSILDKATDIMTWANPGPGAARGLCRMLDLPLNALKRENEADVAKMIFYMQDILAFSQVSKYWPQEWPAWEMREVEHTLCEFDKYERITKDGGHTKKAYVPYQEMEIN